MRFLGINAELDRSRLQAMRAAPPTLAAEDKARRRVFGSALAQFDELLTAAASVGPAVSPIPLYYALTQAGRAIAAAHVKQNDWRASGHGLSVSSPSQLLGEALVSPHVGESNQFAVFCKAIDSGRLTSAVTLNEVWAAVPQLEQVAGLGAEATPAIQLVVRASREGVGISASMSGPRAANLPNNPETAMARLRERLDSYPGAADGLAICEPFSASKRSPSGEPVIDVEWRSADGSLQSVYLAAPGLGPPGAGSYLWPGIGAHKDVLAPLALWWTALLALSSLARYEPDAWLAALARDESLLAIPIEEALAIALEMLPWLVLHELQRTR